MLKRHRTIKKGTPTARIIKANDPVYNSLFKYADNKIVTSKYTVLTFLPKNLFEQFHRVANIYFAFLVILQMLPWVSSLTYITTILPLLFVLSVSAVKDLIDDLGRHKSDRIVNKSFALVLREGELKQEYWQKLKTGEIICLKNNDAVPADLLLLTTSESGGSCYTETTQLDGETSRKHRRAVPELQEFGDDLMKLSNFDGEIECEVPNSRLNRFKGSLSYNNQIITLDNNNIILRGSTMRHTKYCFAIIVYAGAESKLFQNSGKRFLKSTNIDRQLNWLILGVIFTITLLCLICAIGSSVWEAKVGYYFQIFLPWEGYVPGSVQVLDRGGETERVVGAQVIAALHFLSYIILLSPLVPISLYVSVEVVRFSHSLYINWDLQMCDQRNEEKKAFAKARSSNLNEGLGQISYLFTDKTGTLTQNVMKFCMCSINGEVYDVQDRSENSQLASKERSSTHTAAPLGQASSSLVKVERLRKSSVLLRSATGRDALMDRLMAGNEGVWRFFRLIGLCNTAVPERGEHGDISYITQSPDESALLDGIKSFGFILRDVSGNRKISLQVFGKVEQYELLTIIEFSYVRKRMSVVVKDSEGQIILYCKGADMVIRERLSDKTSDTLEATDKHLREFSENGLRTLYCAYKILDENYFNDWLKRCNEALLAMESREETVQELYDELESDLDLIGCTAIEDKLQEGVPTTISRLLNAGLKIWMLTGDKQETAINIACSSGLIGEQTILTFHIQGSNEDEIRRALQRALDHIKRAAQLGEINPDEFDLVPWSELRAAGWPRSCGLDPCTDSCYALVIDGASLVHTITAANEKLLLEVACACRSVVVSRATPLQKAQIVQLVKKYLPVATLAIGDGANDVSMIRMAHIGVGISGQEGMQAALASDFAIAQFRFLERLLLVHGRWSYVRMTRLARYFFYKNFVCTLAQFFYAAFTGFSGQTLYDPLFLTFYNLLFTNVPVMVMAMGDQDVSAELSLLYPKLYQPGMRDRLFNRRVFIGCAVEGAITAAVIFFAPCACLWEALTWDGKALADQKIFGTVVGSIVVVVVTLRDGHPSFYKIFKAGMSTLFVYMLDETRLPPETRNNGNKTHAVVALFFTQCAMEMTYWTIYHHLSIWGSIIFYFLFTIILYSGPFFQSYLHILIQSLQTSIFWLLIILIISIVILPVIIYKFWKTLMRPTLVTKLLLASQRKRYSE